MTVSTNGATLTGPSSTGSLIDASNALWTLTAGFIYRNGVKVQSDEVILLLYWNGAIYQENVNKGWWEWVNSAWLAVAGDPRPTVTPPPPTVTIALGVPYTLGIAGTAYQVTFALAAPTGEPIQTDGAHNIQTDG